MLKVHKTGNKYYNKNNICLARESGRARSKTESEKVSERKAVCHKLHNTRERAICAGNKGARLSGVAATGNAVCKEKVCPCAYNTHKKRVLQAVSTGFMCAFVYKASVGRKIFIVLKGKRV